MIKDNELPLFADDDDAIMSFVDGNVVCDDINKKSWKILIVDDEPEVHKITKIVLRDYTFEGKSFDFLSAYSKREAIEIIERNSDVALILLDVVMESEHAGLECVKYIRDKIKNTDVRIILRTGQPGQSPEEDVVVEYDINDYKSKTELTAEKLFTSVISSLRNFKHIQMLNHSRTGLETIIQSAPDLFNKSSFIVFAEGVLEQIVSLLELDENSLYINISSISAFKSLEDLDYSIVAATGEFSKTVDNKINKCLSQDILDKFEIAIQSNHSIFGENFFIGHMKTSNGEHTLLYLQWQREISDIDKKLLTIFSSNVAAAFDNLSLNLESEKQRKLLTSTFSAIPDPLLVLSDNYDIIDSNQNSIDLFSKISANQDISFLTDIQLVSRIKESLSLVEILKKNRNSLQNQRFKTSEFWFAISASPVDLEDESQGVVVVIRDITTEIIQDLNLVQAQKMDVVGKLVSGVAHDFNNMLGGIQGAADLLSMSVQEEDKELIDLLLNSTEKASKLTRELLSFSRKTAQESVEINIKTIINETIFILERTIDKKIRIIKELTSSRSTILGDDSVIMNAFLNMGINASHAMPSGGNITIRTSNVELDSEFCDKSQFEIVPGDYLLIEFIDTGCGMSEEILGHIFEPFFTTKDAGLGTGLGMVSVYNMAVKHNGAITATSEVGMGTTFQIYLPEIEKEYIDNSATKSKLITGSGNILIVDDEQVNRLVASELIKSLGYNTITAENGSEALDYLKSNSVDLVILDMVMPVMNGRETFEKILEYRIDTKVIFTSGYTEHDDIEKLKKRGLVGVLKKPYHRVELSQIIANGMNG